MTATASDQIRTLSFGALDGGLWGAAFGTAASALVLGDGTGETATLTIGPDEWCPEGRGWRLRGDGFALHIEPVGEDLEAPPEPDPDTTIAGTQELCRVQGKVSLGGREHTVDCVGTRTAIDGVDRMAVGSIRAVSGWLAEDEAFVLLSLRGERGAGQEADLVAATLFDPEGWVSVVDPRLSTTYSETGEPMRMNLELWVGEGENEFPRRAAGEAAGAGAAVTAGEFKLRAVPLRCHSRGREGAGVYILIAGH